MADGMTPADFNAMMGNGCTGDSWVMIILFALIFGGNGFFGNGRGGEQYATSADVQRGFDTQDINSQLRGITYGLSDLGYAIDNKIENAKDYVSAGISNTKDTVVAEGRGLQMQLADCCCTTQRNTDALRFDLANYSAATNASIHSEAEKTRALIQENKIEALQQKINALELANVVGAATANVVRYPTSTVYTGGTSPFCNCNNGCGCNAI